MNMKINFIDPNLENLFGKLEAIIENDDTNNYDGPFTFQIVNTIDNLVKWEIGGMTDGHWATYVEPCNSIANIKNSKGEVVKYFEWETMSHGDFSHKVFLEWCKENKGSKGISIGTHDGTTGEWVVPINDNLIEAYLVEASEKQYNDLVENYKGKSNAHTIMSLVTKDGLDIEFFESEDGFTNSTSREHVLKFSNNVVSVFKKSISLNELIIQCGLENDLKWLHLDVEGIDDELVMSLDDKKIKMPDIIIYESLNLSDDRKRSVIKWLESKSYQCEESGWNTIAKLNKPDLSLLVHTCDSYERFWSGMFYTLDSYWDYNYIPVYFANEEKKMSDIIIDCKGTPYRPDSRIKQILTGKTDKDGFSNRFINAVEKIPSKYLIYIQEDMWLRRNLDNDLIKELIEFMDKVNADSIKIHAKLWYYNSYILEPTEYFVKGQRMLKQINDEFILSHNATIWRKDYLLKYQKEGENPWLNETEASKRMSVDNDNNYHYNIHWYCQPGMSDNGNHSQEFTVYSHIVEEMKSMELKMNLK